MIGPTLVRLLDPRPLSEAEARAVFERLLDPVATELDRVAVLVALAARPIEAAELVAFAREMRRRAEGFEVPSRDAPIDLCGSGGARTPSFNISTVSAFVVAAGGVPVVKHGNRSSRGLCGSSDLLEALGLPVTTSQAFGRESYRARRLAFLHAPLYHPATRAVAEARKAVGIPTIFNRLGPLSNPARVPHQLAGAADVPLARTFALALRRLGVTGGATMASEDGSDEFSPVTPTEVFVWAGSWARRTTVDPTKHLPPEERRGAWSPLRPAQAAREAERILQGGTGARRGSVLLTSGTAFWLTGRADSISAGVERAREVIESGSAAEMLDDLRELARPYRRGAK